MIAMAPNMIHPHGISRLGALSMRAEWASNALATAV